jgi:hypothetical protein
MPEMKRELENLLRRTGQWPECQTEIHFHSSSKEHRDAAAAMLGTYPNLPPRPRGMTTKAKNQIEGLVGAKGRKSRVASLGMTVRVGGVYVGAKAPTP